MKFKVGDVVIIRMCRCDGYPTRQEHLGREVTIIGVSPSGLPGWPKAVYETDMPHCSAPHVWAHHWGCDNCFELKRRPPVKREELGSWDLCPWQPKRVTVSEEASHE